jgi:hypothetical protein
MGQHRPPNTPGNGDHTSTPRPSTPGNGDALPDGNDGAGAAAEIYIEVLTSWAQRLLARGLAHHSVLLLARARVFVSRSRALADQAGEGEGEQGVEALVGEGSEEGTGEAGVARHGLREEEEMGEAEIGPLVNAAVAVSRMIAYRQTDSPLLLQQVWRLAFGVWRLAFGVSGLGITMWGLGCGVEGVV